MRTWIGTLAIATAFVVSSAAAQAGATHMWRCELTDKASEEDVGQMAEEWLAAARKMKGGARLQANVYFPVAVNAIGNTDLIFVVHAPTFEEWGKFWDDYLDSPAGGIEHKYRDRVVCPNSALWESMEVKVK